MATMQEVKSQISAENTAHKNKINSLQKQMTKEIERHRISKGQLIGQLRQLKDVQNSVDVDVYKNENVNGEVFSWDKVVRVPRPNNVSGMSLREASGEFFLNLPSELKDQLLLVDESDQLPRSIDGALLVIGKDALGRVLSGQEKRQMREAFRDEMREDRLATAQTR